MTRNFRFLCLGIAAEWLLQMKYPYWRSTYMSKHGRNTSTFNNSNYTMKERHAAVNIIVTYVSRQFHPV